jgi:hypothetical protein
MGPHDWLGVPRIPSPARDLRVVPFFAASAVAHVALLLALHQVQHPPDEAAQDALIGELLEDARATSCECMPRPGSVEPDRGDLEAAPGARVALALDEASNRRAEGRPAPSGGDALRGLRAAGVDLREVVHAGSWASVTGDADLEAALDGYGDSDFTTGEVEGNWGSGVLVGTCCATGGGWGTIGTRRYGTIETASHTIATGAFDYGGGRNFRPRRAAVPSVQLSRPVVTCADCDPFVFQGAFRKCGSVLRYCYEKELLTFPSLGHVKIAIELVVMPGGNIVGVQLTGGGTDGLHRCIRGHYEAMRVDKNVDEPVGIKLDLELLQSR